MIEAASMLLHDDDFVLHPVRVRNSLIVVSVFPGEQGPWPAETCGHHPRSHGGGDVKRLGRWRPRGQLKIDKGRSIANLIIGLSSRAGEPERSRLERPCSAVAVNKRRSPMSNRYPQVREASCAAYSWRGSSTAASGLRSKLRRLIITTPNGTPADDSAGRCPHPRIAASCCADPAKVRQILQIVS